LRFAECAAARLTRLCVGQASHNPEQDNGVKLVDPSGGMLEVRSARSAAQRNAALLLLLLRLTRRCDGARLRGRRTPPRW